MDQSFKSTKWIALVKPKMISLFFFKIKFKSKSKHACFKQNCFFNKLVMFSRYCVSIVDVDDLPLEHQGINSHNTAQHLIISPNFPVINGLTFIDSSNLFMIRTSWNPAVQAWLSENAVKSYLTL